MTFEAKANFQSLLELTKVRFREMSAVRLHYHLHGTIIYEETKRSHDFGSACKNFWTEHPALRPETLREKLLDDLFFRKPPMPSIGRRSCADVSPGCRPYRGGTVPRLRPRSKIRDLSISTSFHPRNRLSLPQTLRSTSRKSGMQCLLSTKLATLTSFGNTNSWNACTIIPTSVPSFGRPTRAQTPRRADTNGSSAMMAPSRLGGRRPSKRIPTWRGSKVFASAITWIASVPFTKDPVRPATTAGAKAWQSVAPARPFRLDSMPDRPCVPCIHQLPASMARGIKEGIATGDGDSRASGIESRRRDSASRAGVIGGGHCDG